MPTPASGSFSRWPTHTRALAPKETIPVAHTYPAWWQLSESGRAMLADLRAAIEEMDEINRWAADDEMAEDARFADEENEAAEHEAATQAIALAGGNFEAAFTDPDDVAAQERMGTALRAALIKAIENWDAGR